MEKLQKSVTLLCFLKDVSEKKKIKYPNLTLKAPNLKMQPVFYLLFIF